MTEGLKNRGVENIGCNSNKPGITLSPFVLRSKNIGEVARSDGGVNKTDGVRIQARAQSPIPPLSGGEVTRETEGKGRGLFERSEFRSPPTATVATSQKAR